MCNQQLSLLKHCQKCGAKCCIGGEFFGSPIISVAERRAIREFTDKGWLRKVVSPTNWVYYIAEESTAERRCTFLTENNECLIQPVKPMDCLCYPLKAIYQPKRALTVLKDISYEEALETAHPISFRAGIDWDSLDKPPKEIYFSDRVTIVVDTQCPAVEHLSGEFLKAALKVAVKSTSRFDRITYQHWLDNYIGWLERAVALEEVFPSLET